MSSSENRQAYGSSSTKARIVHQLRACGAYARSLIMGLLGQNVASTEIRLSLRLVREYSQQIKLYRWRFAQSEIRKKSRIFIKRQWTRQFLRIPKCKKPLRTIMHC